MNEPDEWATTVTRKRRLMGMKQVGLAEAAGVSPRTIQTIESGGTVKQASLHAVLDALELPHRQAAAQRLVEREDGGEASFHGSRMLMTMKPGRSVIDRLADIEQRVALLEHQLFAQPLEEGMPIASDPAFTVLAADEGEGEQEVGAGESGPA